MAVHALASLAPSLGQSHTHHGDAVFVARQHFEQQQELAVEQQSLRLRTKAQYAKEELRLSRQLYVTRMAHELEIARREGVRDVWKARNEAAQTMMIVESVFIAFVYEVIVGGILPPDTSAGVLVVYSLLLGIAVVTSVIAIVLLIAQHHRLALYDFQRPMRRYPCGKTHRDLNGYFACHCATLNRRGAYSFACSVASSLVLCCVYGSSKWHSHFDGEYASGILFTFPVAASVAYILLADLVISPEVRLRPGGKDQHRAAGLVSESGETPKFEGSPKHKVGGPTAAAESGVLEAEVGDAGRRAPDGEEYDEEEEEGTGGDRYHPRYGTAIIPPTAVEDEIAAGEDALFGPDAGLGDDGELVVDGTASTAVPPLDATHRSGAGAAVSRRSTPQHVVGGATPGGPLSPMMRGTTSLFATGTHDPPSVPGFETTSPSQDFGGIRAEVDEVQRFLQMQSAAPSPDARSPLRHRIRSPRAGGAVGLATTFRSASAAGVSRRSRPPRVSPTATLSGTGLAAAEDEDEELVPTSPPLRIHIDAVGPAAMPSTTADGDASRPSDSVGPSAAAAIDAAAGSVAALEASSGEAAAERYDRRLRQQRQALSRSASASPLRGLQGRRTEAASPRVSPDDDDDASPLVVGVQGPPFSALHMTGVLADEEANTDDFDKAALQDLATLGTGDSDDWGAYSTVADDVRAYNQVEQNHRQVQRQHSQNQLLGGSWGAAGTGTGRPSMSSSFRRASPGATPRNSSFRLSASGTGGSAAAGRGSTPLEGRTPSATPLTTHLHPYTNLGTSSPHRAFHSRSRSADAAIGGIPSFHTPLSRSQSSFASTVSGAARISGGTPGGRGGGGGGGEGATTDGSSMESARDFALDVPVVLSADPSHADISFDPASPMM